MVKVEKYIPINERRSKQKQQEGASFTNLYVTNLPLSTTEKVVRETFQVKFFVFEMFLIIAKLTKL